MCARLLALCCLLAVSTVPSGFLFAGTPSVQLAVYMSADNVQSPEPVEYMKRELASLMEPAGIQVAWKDLGRPSDDNLASHLAVLELHGLCALPNGSASVGPLPENLASLASTAVSSGRVLPFSRVDCTMLSRLLAPSLASEPKARRDYLYGRAMARLIAHELYHVLAKTQDHARAGVAKTWFASKDLLGEDFVFEHGSLAKIRRPVETAALDIENPSDR